MKKILFLTACLAIAGLTCLAGATDTVGVIVESVETGSAGEKAGIKEGDILVAWERLPNPPANPKGKKGSIKNIYDWIFADLEESPRGAIKISGERTGEKITFELPPAGFRGIEVRPRLEPRLLSAYTEAIDALNEKDFDKGAGVIKKLAESTSDIGTSCWLCLRATEILNEERMRESAMEFARFALKKASFLKDSTAEWKAQMTMGDIYKGKNAFKEAEGCYEKAGILAENKLGEGLISAAWERLESLQV